MVGLRSCVCGAGNWLLIDLFVFVKKVEKSLAVKGWWSIIVVRVEYYQHNNES